MSQSEESIVPPTANTSEESLVLPIISKEDTLPRIDAEDAKELSELQVSDGDFHTKAVVNADGRVDINIDQSSGHLARQVIATLKKEIKCHCSAIREAEAEAALPALDTLPASIVGDVDGLPPVKMNIVIHVVGSRGDVQPFVALGKVLREKYGHRVRLATHPTFQTFVEENELEFFSIGGDPAELMAFMVKNPGLMPGLESLRSGDVGERRKGMYQIVKGCWRSCIEAGNGLADIDYSKIHGKDPMLKPFIADAIIANPPSFAHIHCAERLGIPLHLMFTMPWSPTQSFPHPLTTIHSSNAEPNVSNLVSYALVEMMTWQGLGDVMNRFRTKTLGLEPVSLMWAPGMASRLRIPFTYCWSPALIPKPEDWGGHIFISGFYFLSLASSYVPDPALVAFLEKGDSPVYIGFGSIVVEDPDAMTKLIFDAVKKAGVRALVSKGWGGFGGDELNIPKNIYMLGNIPHDWLFKHVSAVVHHGGAGTTAAGILAGRPTVIVPFFGDQPFWGSMVSRAGAGPEPIPFKSLTSDALAIAILKALTSVALQKAKELGESLAKEDGAAEGAQSFHNMLDMKKYRCCVAPKRNAVVRIKKTHIRLSPLAAIVLGDAGLIKSSNLKLYRPCEYDSEDGPWDPITGGASALLGTLSSLMVGIADLPVEIITGLKTSVQKSNAERADKAKAASIASSTDLTLSKQSTLDSTVSGHSNVNSTSSESAFATTTDVTDSDTIDIYGNKMQEKEIEMQFLTPDKRSHTISVNDVHKPKHSHTIKPGDSHSHKATVVAEEGASSAAITILRPAMDFTLSIARGFHNAPKLYGDDTVRATGKITDFKTGVTTAGKEFAYGWYDGISGLVTQPFNGAKEHGVKGFLEGIGKGVGGFVLKPGSAIFGLGGYTFKGVYRELQKHMGATTHAYIIAARITQGHEDWTSSTSAERQSIIDNYMKIKDDPLMQKHSNHSSAELSKHMHHHNDSGISIGSEASVPVIEHRHHGHAHFLRNHFSHREDEGSESGLDSDRVSLDSEKHKHSIRAHLPHFHSHKSKEVLIERVSHTEVLVHGVHEDAQVVSAPQNEVLHSAEVPKKNSVASKLHEDIPGTLELHNDVPTVLENHDAPEALEKNSVVSEVGMTLSPVPEPQGDGLVASDRHEDITIISKLPRDDLLAPETHRNDSLFPKSQADISAADTPKLQETQNSPSIVSILDRDSQIISGIYNQGAVTSEPDKDTTVVPDPQESESVVTASQDYDDRLMLLENPKDASLIPETHVDLKVATVIPELQKIIPVVHEAEISKVINID